MALPFLDAMVPAMAHAAADKAPVRMAFVYVPNGIICGTGIRITRASSGAAAHSEAAGAVQGRHHCCWAI